MSTAPPLGLIPKWVRDEQRALEIVEAMLRYVAFSKKIPRAWLDELAEIYVEETGGRNEQQEAPTSEGVQS
jgi:hypothetical protein